MSILISDRLESRRRSEKLVKEWLKQFVPPNRLLELDIFDDDIHGNSILTFMYEGKEYKAYLDNGYIYETLPLEPINPCAKIGVLWWSNIFLIERLPLEDYNATRIWFNSLKAWIDKIVDVNDKDVAPIHDVKINRVPFIRCVKKEHRSLFKPAILLEFNKK